MAEWSFKLTCRQDGGWARCGELVTPHGRVRTPAFMPVGTRGTVKGVLPDRLGAVGAEMILANTYHLMLRPGAEVVERLGGLHRFMAWDGPILTDSGGYQVFSLSGLNRIGEDEVEFASHIDGARFRLSPAIATRVQNHLGADIIMAFDECVALPASRERLEQAVERTVRWAVASKQAHQRRDQAMFGIVQGGTDVGLRRYCAEALTRLDFPGYAIGGLSVGEGHEAMVAAVEATTPFLPEDRPRYLMGVGTPADLVASIAAGVDMFDCVMPTRNGRNGCAFTAEGVLRLKNRQYAEDLRPIDPGCSCPACRGFSRGAIRHWLLVNERAGAMLLSIHNLAFYQRLMQQAREAIAENRFAPWARPWLSYQYRPQGNGQPAPA